MPKIIPAQLTPKKLHNEMQVVRNTGRDLTLKEHLAASYDGMTVEGYYRELDINASEVTIGDILDRQAEDVRWLVPEIFRDAIRIGFINSPIYRDFIIREETTPQPTQVAPFWDTTGLNNKPEALGAGESMTLGSLKYGQKTVHISKSGIGIEIADEAIRYTNISLLSLFLQDVGIKLASSLTVDLINVLINGDQADGSQASGVVGVGTPGTMIYNDFIAVFVRGGLRNRHWTRVIGNEATINYMMDMPEFRISPKFAQPELKMNVKTPGVLPSQIDSYVHSAVPNNQLIMVDTDLAAVQLTSQPLTVESDRIVARQINGTYVSLTTGFMNIFSDARIIMDRSVNSPFPASYAPLF